MPSKSKTTRPPLGDKILRRWDGSKFIPNKNAILGREKDIILPNGERHKACYAIVSLQDIIASHKENTFASSDGYPINESGYNINDRNYAGDRAAQAIVQQYADNLEPELLVTNVATPSGTPIISTDGIVVSGNNRTMSIKLASSLKNNPKYRAYIDTLEQEASVFGLDLSKTKIEDPILVRIDYDFSAYTTQELAKYNAQETKGKRPVDKAVELANILQENTSCQASLPKILGEYERISDFYSTPSDCYKMIRMIEGCGILNSNEIVSYFDKDTNTFTEAGKDFLETTLVAIVLQREALIAANTDGVKSMRQILVTTLPTLMTNKSLGEPALNRYINDAVELQLAIKNSGLKFGEYLMQGNLFDAKKWPIKSLVLNRLIQIGRNAFKAALSAYNSSIQSSAGASMFGEPVTPEEAFDAHIKSKLDKSDLSAIDQYAKLCGICQHSDSNKNPDDKTFTAPIEKASKSISAKGDEMFPAVLSYDIRDKKHIDLLRVIVEDLFTQFGNVLCSKEVINAAFKKGEFQRHRFNARNVEVEFEQDENYDDKFTLSLYPKDRTLTSEIIVLSYYPHKVSASKVNSAKEIAIVVSISEQHQWDYLGIIKLMGLSGKTKNISIPNDNKQNQPLTKAQLERRIRVFRLLLEKAKNDDKPKLERRIRVFELLLKNSK